MRAKYFLVKIFFVLFFLFILLFVNRPVKAQDNHQGQCKLQNVVSGHYNDPQYFTSGSSICSFSDVAVPSGLGSPPSNYGTQKVNDGTLLVSPIINNTIQNDDQLKRLLKTYYYCNNGQWIERSLEGNQYCTMPEGFWKEICYVGKYGDCLNEKAGEVKSNTIGAGIDIKSDDFNNLFFSLVPRSTPTKPVPKSTSPTPSEPAQEIPDGAIRCYKGEKPDLSLLKFQGENDRDDKWGCLNIFFTDLCVSNFFNKAQQSAVNFLDQDGMLDKLQEIGACPPGYSPTNISDPNCYCEPEDELNSTRISETLCLRYIASGEVADLVNNTEFVDCSDCFAGGGYWSGLDCIYFSDWENFFKRNVFGLLLGLAGVIALFCIIYAAFQIQTSQGSPEKIKKGQELLTSCIIGLMVIIFSIFILKLIGVDILRIPGFGK